MTSRAWAASGRRRAAAGGRAPRPPDSWSAAVARAAEWWDHLTGGRPADGRYSDVAAAAILSTAAVLWADTAAAMAAESGDGAGI